MAASLVKASYQATNAILDGFIVTAKRSGAIATATIIDTPALLAMPARLINNGSDIVEHCPVLSLAAGRDALLVRGDPGAQSETPQHGGTWLRGYVQVGVAPTANTTLCRSRPSMNTLPLLGVVNVEPVLATEGFYPVNTTAFMSRTDRVVYQLQMFAPTLGLAAFSADSSGWVSSRSTAYPAPWSVRVTDSVMTGVLPFSKRVAPPPYDPSSSAATVYNGAQNIWMRAVSVGITGNVHTLFVVAAAVFDMTNDDDRFGARGLWFARLEVNTADPLAPAASVVWESTYDMRASGDPRSTPLIFSDIYERNNVQPAMMCRLDSGHVITLAASNCSRPDIVYPPYPIPVFNTVSSYVLDPLTGAVSRSVAVGPVLSNSDFNLPMQPGDCAYPVGADTDGESVYSVYFSTDSIRQIGYPPPAETSLVVVKSTISGSAVVLSTMTPYRVCYFAGTPTTECVTYIGNDKYLFVASNIVAPIGISTAGDLCVLVYDAANNSIALAGTVDPTVQQAPNLIIGRMDCPAKEIVDDLGVVVRKATILLTTGGKAQSTAEPGGEVGKTYISHDSGATWVVIASYGSPAGVQYCGTQLITRATEL